jgi:hypothetical protein
VLWQLPFNTKPLHIATGRKTLALEADLDKIMYVHRKELPNYVDSPWDCPIEMHKRVAPGSVGALGTPLELKNVANQ